MSEKQVVSFSGGRTSAYLCHLMKEKHGDDVDFVYCDTGAEHPETYEFLRKCNDHFDLNLTCIRVDINPELGKGNSFKVIDIDDCKQDLQPFKEMMNKYGTPYIHGAFCTDRMKTDPYKKYCDDKYGNDNYTTWLGMRIDEQRRLKHLESKQINFIDLEDPKKKINIRYLAEVSDFEKQDVLDWWSEMPFDLGIPEPLGNCVFCIKKGINKLAYATKAEPEMAVEFIKIIEDESVREPKRNFDKRIMYRGNHSLRSIMLAYELHEIHEIEKTIQSMKSLDAGACSESCEAFSNDGNNFDLFLDNQQHTGDL